MAFSISIDHLRTGAGVVRLGAEARQDKTIMKSEPRNGICDAGILLVHCVYRPFSISRLL